MPTIRRESVQSDGRPKREIHPPPPRDLPYSDFKPRRKKAAAELKFCDQVMKELMKKQHEAYAYPFYTPVDPVALNIPDYFRIIKKPMDLSTVQNKLKTNQYDNANEFEADIRLMLSNCYKFNPNGTAVNNMGKRVEEVFNKKWAEKTAFIQSQSGSRSPVSPSPPPDGEMSDDDPQVEILQKQLEMMQKQLAAMKGKKKSSPPAVSQGSKKGKAGSSAAGRKGSISQSASQRKKSGPKKAEEVPLLSMEEKQELSQRINLLSANKMLYATKLIQENLPNLSVSIDYSTLMKLQMLISHRMMMKSKSNSISMISHLRFYTSYINTSRSMHLPLRRMQTSVTHHRLLLPLLQSRRQHQNPRRTNP